MSTLKKTIKVLKKRVRLSSLLFLIFTLSMNTFAWFVYATKVDSTITARVKSWKVTFLSGTEELQEYVDFTVSTLYPGMSNYSDSITISNTGETVASVSYEIESVTIMGSTYTVNGSSITSSTLENMLRNDYPFLITFGFSSNNISSGGSTTFSINASWTYDSGNDANDTYWGNQAYTYVNEHPDEPCITVTVKVTAVQSNS